MNRVFFSKTRNLHEENKHASSISSKTINFLRMKNLLIIALLFSGLSTVLAQTEIMLLNYNTLEKKFAKSNDDIGNPKKSLKAKTWFSRGEILQDIFDIDIEYLSEGIDKTRIQLYYKAPNKIVTETMENGQKKGNS
jgi:hypothetical protein